MVNRILRYRMCAGCLVGVALWLSAGCARPNAAIAAQPTAEELPNLQEPESAIGPTVVIEGRAASPRQPLVANLEPPNLTAEEEEALGVKPVHYKFLQYNEVWTPKGSKLGPWYGGVLTASDDYRNPGAVGWPLLPLAGTSGWGGALTGVDPVANALSGTYSPNTGVVIAGPRSGVVVETDPTATPLARHREYREH
jgi:hypothetical protein